MATLGLRGRLVLTFNVGALLLVGALAAVEVIGQGRIVRVIGTEVHDRVAETQASQHIETDALRRDAELAARQALTGKVDALAHLLAELAPIPLVTKDTEALDVICAQVDRDQDVVWTAILDGKGKLVSTYAGASLKSLMKLADQPTAAQALAALPTLASIQVQRVEVKQGSKILGTALVVASQAAVERQLAATGERFAAIASNSEESFRRLEGRIAERATSTRRLVSAVFIAVAVVGALGMIAASLWIAHALIMQIQQVGHALAGLAEGNLTRRARILRRDETGAMAGAFNRSAEKLAESVQTMSVSVEATSGAASQLESVAQVMSGSADTTATQSQMAAAAAEQVSRGTSAIAAGMEEMSASVSEISRNTQDAARTAKDAVGAAAEARDAVVRLDAAGQDIGEIVKLVATIAGQTNLLALNATIEASRAGEAGRGFAVVANEVKALARRTQQATEEITSKTAVLRAGGEHAQQALERIVAIVQQIDQLQQSIASAVEQQAITTREIGGNIASVASGATGMATSISATAATAATTRNAVADTRAAAAHLAALSTDLKTALAWFRQ